MDLLLAIIVFVVAYVLFGWTGVLVLLGVGFLLTLLFNEI